jgi:hypothetical protein
MDSNDGVRAELAKSREWQKAQAIDSENTASDDAIVSATISVTRIRRVKSLEAILADDLLGSVYRINVGFPSSNGFYSFNLSADMSTKGQGINGQLLADFQELLQREQDAMAALAADPTAEASSRDIGQAMAKVFSSEIVRARTDGLPIYSVTLKDASGKAAKRTNKSGPLSGAILSLVPKGCDVVEPVYPDEAADSWGAVEDRGRAVPAPATPAPAPLS